MLMLDEYQEDKVRDLLSIVCIYFQMPFDYADESKIDVIKAQRQRCKEAVNSLVQIMAVDNSFPGKKYGSIPVSTTPSVNGYAMKKLANTVMDKLGYKKEGREKFIQKCIDKVME